MQEINFFIESFIGEEYELVVEAILSKGSRETHMKKVNFFLDKYVINDFLKQFFSEIRSWDPSESEEKKQDWLKSYCKRRLFLIEHRKNVEFDEGIRDQGFKINDIFVCYVSDYKKSWNDYYNTRYILAFDSNNDIKIVAIENYRIQEWKDYSEFKRILDYGEPVDVLRVEAPNNEKNLEHYNSF